MWSFRISYIIILYTHTRYYHHNPLPQRETGAKKLQPFSLMIYTHAFLRMRLLYCY